MDEGERMERAEGSASRQDNDVMAARMASMEAKIARRDKLAWIKDLFVPVVTLMLMYLGYRLNADANARQIAEAQQAQVRAAEARNQKYLEFFLANFADKAKQPAAVRRSGVPRHAVQSPLRLQPLRRSRPGARDVGRHRAHR
jgi:hypothetical protein